MSHPKVSIGLPVFNGANFLRASVRSILTQDYEDLELIIADNASTDDTEAICHELADKDARVRYYRNPTNLGASQNYNKVFHLARGEYFKWAAHDDECHRSMIRRCVEFLDQASPAVTLVYPLAELIDEQGRTLRAPLDRIESRDPRAHRRLARLLQSLNMCDPVFGLFRTEQLRKTRLIGPFFGADYVLLGELAMLGELRELTEVLFRLRAHSQRSMQANAGNRAKAAWFHPSNSRRLLIVPGWERMIWELLRSVRRSPLHPLEKLKCLLVVPTTHYWRRFRNSGGRARARAKALFGARTGTKRAHQLARRRL